MPRQKVTIELDTPSGPLPPLQAANYFNFAFSGPEVVFPLPSLTRSLWLAVSSAAVTGSWHQVV